VPLHDFVVAQEAWAKWVGECLGFELDPSFWDALPLIAKA